MAKVVQSFLNYVKQHGARVTASDGGILQRLAVLYVLKYRLCRMQRCARQSPRIRLPRYLQSGYEVIPACSRQVLWGLPMSARGLGLRFDQAEMT
jgi:hypothetical protein